MIEIRQAEIIKSGIKLFQDLSWKIQEHEHWVISGANGSGKTTLLELLAGVRYLTKGEVHYDFIQGDSWDERHLDKKRKIKYIPAHAIQQFIHNGTELYYQQRYYGIGDERTLLVKDVLGDGVENLSALQIPASLSIDHLLLLEVTRLSNGQLKKVLLLKSLLKGVPEMLLLDYPFEGLDHTSRKDLCDFIDYIATTYSITIILVDHGHQLPKVMNKRLQLDDCRIVGVTDIVHSESEAISSATQLVTSKEGETEEEVIRIKDLTIQYGNKVILNDFNWTVTKGQRWALTGRNGAGKTTLFSLFFADHPMAYSQQIYLFGKKRGSGESIWDIKKRINYLGPELVSYLNPEGILMTAKEHITNSHKRWNEDTLCTLIAYFHADSFMHKPVRSLSSGELQLMLIIQCFLMDKELLLLDEPFQFLDETQKDRVRSYIQSHLDTDTTLILITHYENEVKEWTQHIKRL